MPFPKPTPEQRQKLLAAGLVPLDDTERQKLFGGLDALFESVLTDTELLHEDVDNPIEHHTVVLEHMMRIAKGEGFSWEAIRRAAAIAILHDIQPAKRITREMRGLAKTPEEKVNLELKNLQNRIFHMRVGSWKAREKLQSLHLKFGRDFFTEEAIEAICGVIVIHDLPSINLPISANAQMAVAFREADRLWMMTRFGLTADLKRKKILNPTEAQLVEQADKNLESYKKERALYNAAVEQFQDTVTFFRTPTGYRIFKELRQQWQH